MVELDPGTGRKRFFIGRGRGLEEKRAFPAYRSLSNLATYKAFSDRNWLKCVNFGGFQNRKLWVWNEIHALLKLGWKFICAFPMTTTCPLWQGLLWSLQRKPYSTRHTKIPNALSWNDLHKSTNASSVIYAVRAQRTFIILKHRRAFRGF